MTAPDLKTERRWFFERRITREWKLSRSGDLSFTTVTDEGHAAWELAGGEVRQRAGSGPSADVPPHAQRAFEALPWPSIPDAPERVLRACRERALALGAGEFEIKAHLRMQEVACVVEEQVLTDRREYVSVEVRAAAPGAPWADAAVRWRSFPTFEEFLRRAATDPRLVDEAPRTVVAGTPRVACPTGDFPMLLPPGGASGSFFHEVCGHPLEGDVVLRQSSYLARLLGKKVAPAHLSVVDDPTGEDGSLQYAFDDEGTASTPTWMIRDGVIDQPLLDVRTARALGREPNGHGRRVDFRHAPLPRMGHTRVVAGPESPAGLFAGIRVGILVQHLTPRQMNLLTGDFCFHINEARLIQDGQPGPLLGPGIIRGNGLESLSAIEALGNDPNTILATRGCRKLDHGPLHVGFGQPTIRFARMRFEGAR